MKFIFKILLSAVAVLIIGYFLPGVDVESNSVVIALWVALILGLLFTFLKPILVVLTLPVTIITLGLFLLVINALIILLASRLVDGFHVDGFWWALLFSILLSVVESFLYKILD